MPVMKSAFTILIAFFCLSVSLFAQQRPLITEDVDIVPEGSARISAGVDFLQDAKFPLSGLKGDETRVGDVQISFGLAPNVEFQIDGVLQNFLAINSMQNPAPIPLNIGTNSTNGIGDFTLSTKIKLRNESRAFPAIGFKLGIQLPNSDQSKGIGVNQTNIFGNIILQKKFGKKKGQDARANVFGNIGLGILTAPLERFSQNDVLLYGLAGIFRVNKNINIASEVNGRANTRSGQIPLGTESVSQFRIGAQIKASNLRFDTAAIFGLTQFSPRTGFTFGVTYQSPQIFAPAR
ncbi:MAG: hypothetical protein ACR2N3_18865 [Pyrinomonadaceae bacterium]